MHCVIPRPEGRSPSRPGLVQAQAAACVFRSAIRGRGSRPRICLSYSIGSGAPIAHEERGCTADWASRSPSNSFTHMGGGSTFRARSDQERRSASISRRSKCREIPCAAYLTTLQGSPWRVVSSAGHRDPASRTRPEGSFRRSGGSPGCRPCASSRIRGRIRNRSRAG